MVHTIVLGAIQALSEFLPVSSSGHLIVIPWLLGWEDHSLSFDIALHLGTMAAVIVYFLTDIIKMIRGFLASIYHKNPKYNDDSILAWLIILATVPGAVIGFFLNDMVETIFRNPLLIAFTLSFVGIVLYFADKYGANKRDLRDLTVFAALLIGLGQCFAIIPGVSRSGATISVALILGYNRYFSARFSFLLAIPIITGAGLLHANKILSLSLEPGFFVGMAISFIFGLVAIKILLKLVQTRTYRIFVYYRILLSLVILVSFLFLGRN